MLSRKVSRKEICDKKSGHLYIKKTILFRMEKNAILVCMKDEMKVMENRVAFFINNK